MYRVCLKIFPFSGDFSQWPSNGSTTKLNQTKNQITKIKGMLFVSDCVWVGVGFAQVPASWTFDHIVISLWCGRPLKTDGHWTFDKAIKFLSRIQVFLIHFLVHCSSFYFLCYFKTYFLYYSELMWWPLSEWFAESFRRFFVPSLERDIPWH